MRLRDKIGLFIALASFAFSWFVLGYVMHKPETKLIIGVVQGPESEIDAACQDTQEKQGI